MTVHFVYAGDPHNNMSCSPYTITKNLYKRLQDEFAEIIYYDWCETRQLDVVKPGDIIIGHPNYPDNTPTRKLFKNAIEVGGCVKILIFPFHHAMAEINLPFDDLVNQADSILSITGPFWYDTIDDSPFAHWKHKITRLDMAIDINSFPYSKTTFNRPGSRQFVYIGCDRPEKNLDWLYEIFRRIPYRLHTYGNIGHRLINLPNIHHHGWATIDREFGQSLCAIADVFINTSKSDANPTTCTEVAGFGLVVACTKQSGYWPNQPFIGLSSDNIDDAMTTIAHMQTCDSIELIKQSQKQRQWVEEMCLWDKFCDKVIGCIKTTMINCGIQQTEVTS